MEEEVNIDTGIELAPTGQADHTTTGNGDGSGKLSEDRKYATNTTSEKTKTAKKSQNHQNNSSNNKKLPKRLRRLLSPNQL